jgi:hypothetical protein
MSNTPNLQTWDLFCEANPAWNSEKAYVCFRDDPRYNGKFVLKQCVQSQGLSFIHAPVVLLHYLYLRSHPEFDKMIDITELAICAQTGLLDCGEIIQPFKISGNSLDLFRHLTKHKVLMKSCNIEDITIDKLKQYGPLLVHSLTVLDDLIFGSISSHIGRPKDPYSSTIYEVNKKHSILCVGMREEDGKKYFLFQNWWRGKQFFETDAEFLEQCEPQIHYAYNDVYQFISAKLVSGDYFETSCDLPGQGQVEIYNNEC